MPASSRRSAAIKPRPRVHDAVKSYAVRQVGRGNLTIQQATDTGDISRSQLYREIKSFKETGQIRERGKSSGTNLKAPEAAREYVLALFRHRPSLYLDEAAALLLRYFNIEVHKSTISRWLKAANITHKKLTRRDRKRDDEARLDYTLMMGQFRLEQLVFADETHFDQRNANRSEGWAPSGERAEEVQNTARSGGISVLPAMDHRGLFAVWSVEGAVDGEKFRYWVEHFLLPEMTPFPGPRSVLILDNCNIHKGQQLREMVEEHGCLLQFLPAYTPELNPIENAFSTIKAAVSRDGSATTSDIVRTCYEAVDAAQARALFRNSGYV